MEAALKAKVRVVALRSGGWSDEDLRGAERVYEGVADLLDNYEASPFAAR